jgi:hypothetical protein
MKRTLLILLILIQVFNNLNAQVKFQVDCNTIFIGIDTATYHALFANKCVKDTLFICKQATSYTNKDTYTGKYLIGESANIEFFAPKPTGKLGDKIGDVGVELKTRLVNQLQELINSANLLNVPIDTANISYQDADTTINWYTSVATPVNDDNFSFSTLAYHPQYLKYVGFTDAEILLPITFKQYHEKLSGGKPYPRLFSAIKSISISANQAQLKKINQFLKLNDFTNHKGKSANNNFTVFYKNDNRQSNLKLNCIKIALLAKQSKRQIVISNALTILVDGDKATLLFK